MYRHVVVCSVSHVIVVGSHFSVLQARILAYRRSWHRNVCDRQPVLVAGHFWLCGLRAFLTVWAKRISSSRTTLRTPLSGTCLLKEVCRKPLFGVCSRTSPTHWHSHSGPPHHKDRKITPNTIQSWWSINKCVLRRVPVDGGRQSVVLCLDLSDWISGCDCWSAPCRCQRCRPMCFDSLSVSCFYLFNTRLLSSPATLPSKHTLPTHRYTTPNSKHRFTTSFLLGEHRFLSGTLLEGRMS